MPTTIEVPVFDELAERPMCRARSCYYGIDTDLSIPCDFCGGKLTQTPNSLFEEMATFCTSSVPRCSVLFNIRHVITSDNLSPVQFVKFVSCIGMRRAGRALLCNRDATVPVNRGGAILVCEGTNHTRSDLVVNDGYDVKMKPKRLE